MRDAVRRAGIPLGRGPGGNYVYACPRPAPRWRDPLRGYGVTIPADIGSLADYERHAAACLTPDAWRHIQEGADAGGNRAAFDALRLLPRVMTDLRGGDTAIELFGRRHAVPILLAPIAYQRIAHPEGEHASARAATALGTGMVVSTLSSVPLEEVAAAARQAAADLNAASAPLWFQLYLQPDRAQSAALVRRAEAAGYEAIVLTVDAAIKRSSFTLPDGVDETAVLELASLGTALDDASLLQFDPFLVRGMGYYTGTIFEVAHPELGYSLGGGGRYDGMIGRFLGTEVPAAGMSLGFERLVDLVTLPTDAADDAVALIHDGAEPAVLAALKTALIAGGSRVRLEKKPRKLPALLDSLAASGFSRFAVVGADVTSVDDLEFRPLAKE